MSNLITWALQVTLLIAVGAVVSRFLGNAKARLLFWQDCSSSRSYCRSVQPWTQLLPVAMAPDAGDAHCLGVPYNTTLAEPPAF